MRRSMRRLRVFFFVLGEIVAGFGAQQNDRFLRECSCAFCGWCKAATWSFCRNLVNVGDQLVGHLGGRQNVIDQAGRNGAARHAVEFGGFGRLGHRHAAFGLDGAHAQGAVAAGAGEHDADGAVALVGGEERKKKSMGRRMTAGGGGLEQLQFTAQQSHVAVRGE